MSFVVSTNIAVSSQDVWVSTQKLNQVAMSIARSYQLSQRLSEYKLAAHLLFINAPRGAKCKELKRDSFVISPLLIIAASVSF